MDTDVSVLTDEEVLAVFGQCNESLKLLTSQWQKEVTAPRSEAALLHDAVVAAMSSRHVDAVKHKDVYVRLKTKKRVQRALTPDLIADVISNLSPETFREKMEQIDAERALRYEAWREKNSKPKTRKTAVTRKRKNEGDPEVVPDAGTNTVVGVPDEPFDIKLPPRCVGRYTSRPLPPMCRPLTRHEALCAVLYSLIEDGHQRSLAVLAVTPTLGRVPLAKVSEAANAEDPLFAAATFCDLMSSAADASARIRSERPKFRNKMTDCDSRVRSYLRAVDPESCRVKRVLATPDGDRTITVSAGPAPPSLSSKYDDAQEDVEADDGNDGPGAGTGVSVGVGADAGDKDDLSTDDDMVPKRTKKMTLRDVSEIVDNAVDATCAVNDFIKHDKECLFSYSDIPRLTSSDVLQTILKAALSHAEHILGRSNTDECAVRDDAEPSLLGKVHERREPKIYIRRTRLRPSPLS